MITTQGPGAAHFVNIITLEKKLCTSMWTVNTPDINMNVPHVVKYVPLNMHCLNMSQPFIKCKIFLMKYNI